MLSTVLLGAAAVMAGVANAQVTATGTMGVTNPTAASLGTAVNMSSYARLLSLNAIDDFCVFAPPEAGSTIGDTETIQVAWCVQPRNDARVIPDGTLSAVHFVRTPLYYQVQGFGDFTRMNIASGDEGGELDPHGSTGAGNPVGGNVTCNATGSDVSYEEWMNYMSYQQFCLRICIAENSTYSAAVECQHTLDEMGCAWVMPGDYTNGTFTDCEADSAYPPGIYPLANGSTSTFAQRYTGSYTNSGTLAYWTIGYTSTPQTAYSTPASSSCTTYSTVSNGIPTAALTSGAYFTYTPGMTFTDLTTSTESASTVIESALTDSAGATTGTAEVTVAATDAAAASASASSSSSSKAASAGQAAFAPSNGPLVAGAFSVLAALAGVGAVML